ncbi:MAG: hypothetical protein ACLSGS_12015 [Adlercreutzia sp.]
MSRFYDATEGTVRIGGVDVRDLDYDDLLAHVAVVFQKTFLTSGSILENIRMGKRATLDEVREAAAGAHRRLHHGAPPRLRHRDRRWASACRAGSASASPSPAILKDAPCSSSTRPPARPTPRTRCRSTRPSPTSARAARWSSWRIAWAWCAPATAWPWWRTAASRPWGRTTRCLPRARTTARHGRTTSGRAASRSGSAPRRGSGAAAARRKRFRPPCRRAAAGRIVGARASASSPTLDPAPAPASASASTSVFAKNRDFSVSVACTVIEGLLSGCNFGLIFLVMQQVFSGAADFGTLLGLPAPLLVFVLRLLIYGYGYVRGQIGRAQVSRNLRQYLGDKIKRIPSRGSPSGRAATTSTRSPRT